MAVEIHTERAQGYPTERSPRPIIVKSSFYIEKGKVREVARNTLQRNGKFRVPPDYTESVRDVRRMLGEYVKEHRD